MSVNLAPVVAAVLHFPVAMSAPSASAASAAGAAAASSSDAKPTFRRDQLLAWEREVQAQWEAAHLFEATAGDACTRKPEDKFLATFPYPYSQWAGMCTAIGLHRAAMTCRVV
jgi:hypothetical protein